MLHSDYMDNMGAWGKLRHLIEANYVTKNYEKRTYIFLY